MTSAARLVGVLAIGILFLGAVIGSILLAQADALMTIPLPVGGWTLPTPTLFPTAPPRAPVLSLPTPTATGVAPTVSPQVAATATGSPENICTDIPEGWVHYSVKPGDTFFSLAERSATTLPALLDANCKPAAYPLQTGETLYLPSIALVSPTSTPFTCEPPMGWHSVIVHRGDTFSSLARRYGIDLSILLSMNCRDSTRTDLLAGQTINVPLGAVVPPTWPPLPTAWPTLPIPPSATPTPTPTSTPMPTPTPTDTLIPSPTLTPTETPILVPTWTATPPDWELPTAGPPTTSEPSTPTPDPALTPTFDPALTPTPDVSATVDPAATATAGATATATATPTQAGQPSLTPEPTTSAPLIPAPPPTATPDPGPVVTDTATPESTAGDSPTATPAAPTATTAP